MLVSCWSAKGGSGTTVVSVALAALFSRSSPGGALLADLAGDVPAVLGLPEPTGPGLSDWLVAGDDVPTDALSRLEIEAGNGLSILPLGTAATPAEGPSAGAGRHELLAALLAADPRPVVVDCGVGPAGAGLAVAAGASVSLLVIRPCYLALRRALAAPLRPSAAIVVTEPGRTLSWADVEQVLGVPVKARIVLDPAVARAVDAGLSPGRLPRSLERALRHAA